MIKLILNHLLNKRNKIFFITYFIIIILTIVINLPLFEEYYLSYLNKEYYILVFNEVVKELYKILFVIFTTIITIDHFNSYINNITTYKSRMFVIMYKFISYIYLIIINSLMLILFYYLIPFIFNYDFLTNLEFIKYILYLFLDNIIIMFFILMFVRSSNKIIAYIFMIIYIILSLIDYKSNYIFYIFPIQSYNYTNLDHHIIYILTYIVVLMYVNIIKYNIEDFIIN